MREEAAPAIMSGVMMMTMMMIDDDNDDNDDGGDYNDDPIDGEDRSQYNISNKKNQYCADTLDRTHSAGTTTDDE